MNDAELAKLLDELDKETPSDSAVAVLGAGSMIGSALVMLTAQRLPALQIVHFLADRLALELANKEAG